MAFTTLDSLISAWSLERGQKLVYMKTMVGACAQYVPHSFWTTAGTPSNPTTGASPTNGKANGRVVVGGESPTNGAPRYTLPTGGRTMHLVGCAFAANGSGSLNGSTILLDRIADVNLNIDEATGAITGMDATSRLASTAGQGDGGQLWGEVTTAFGAGSNTFNVTYTNQLGVGSRVTPNFSTVASAVVNRSINAGLYIPLQDGDTGVRSVESITLVSGAGTATGKWNLCIVRPFCTVPIPSAGVMIDRDMVTNNPSLPRVWDNTAFTTIMLPSVATTLNTYGEIRICEG